MARKIFLVFSFWVLNLLAHSALAQQAIDVYRIEVPITDQSDAERIAAAKANMGSVVVRVLGNSAGLEHPLIQDAIKDAPSYLAQYSYSVEKTLVLNYSPLAIQTLLQKAQLIAANASTANSVTLYVVNVNNFVAFKQVQAYLKTVGVIRTSTLVSVDKEVLQFNLLLDGDEQSLKRTLSAGNKLNMVVGDTQHPLSFRWQN